MIFGRKKNPAPTDPEVVDSPVEDTDDELDEDVADELEDDELDEWQKLDAQDWRDEGPFDITEVDLEADDVVRLDLGALVLTPFEGMQVQLQVEEATQQVNALLVMHGESGIEVALFAAPKNASMIGEVRDEMVADATASGGTATLAEGPFGTEIRRVLPVAGPDGEQLLHVSRTWLVQGPRWLLRGVLLGQAGQQPNLEGQALELFEFFANIVVRRGDKPLAAGDLIGMQLPQGVTA